MERTQREEALARLKSVQDRLLAGSLPSDQMNSLFKEFTEGVMGVLSKPENASPSVRRMKFSGVGDIKNQRAEMLASLPKEVQKGLDESVILGALLRKPASATKHFKSLLDRSPELQEFKKAMDSATADEGGDWVPTNLSPDLVAEVTQSGMIENMHPHITMPTQPYEIPLQIGRLTAYLATQQTASTGQTGVTKSATSGITDKLTLTAVDLAVEVLTSKHLEEDSIVAILPFLRSEVVMSLMRGVEEACINGDTTGTHMDTDIEAAGATDRRTAWKGYRKLALENSYTVDFQGSGNGFDFDTFMKVRAKHGKYGINPADLFWVLSLQTFFKALTLKDTAGNAIVTTVDKFGTRATALTGVLGVLGGQEIAVSEFARDDLNSSGVNGASGNTLSAILSVQKSGFVFGDRRDARIQLLDQLYAEYQQDALLSVIRKAFAPLRPIATNASVALGYNIALA